MRETLLDKLEAEADRLDKIAAEMKPICAWIAKHSVFVYFLKLVTLGQKILQEKAEFDKETSDQSRLFTRDPG